jgi:hypothetical protein
MVRIQQGDFFVDVYISFRTNPGWNDHKDLVAHLVNRDSTAIAARENREEKNESEIKVGQKHDESPSRANGHEKQTKQDAQNIP